MPTFASTAKRRSLPTTSRRNRKSAQYAPGETVSVPMHDGSNVVLRKLDPAYDPTDRAQAAAYVQDAR